jgi:hypothetical protein
MMTRLSETFQNLRIRVLLVKGTSTAMPMFAPTENWMAATWSYGENADRCNLLRLNLRF